MSRGATRCAAGGRDPGDDGVVSGHAWGWPVLAAVSGWYLTGLAVTVAVVVYPSFALVGPERWTAFHRAHSRAVTRAVAPGWLLEGVATVGWWVAAAGDGAGAALASVHAVAAAVTVALTVGLAVPCHTDLAPGFAAAPHRRLAVVHRWRTLAWSVAATSATAGAVACGR